MIPRPHVMNQIDRALGNHPIAALWGPRQCGKTTVARLIAERESATYFDLENPVDVRRLSAPFSVLQELSGLVIVDAELDLLVRVGGKHYGFEFKYADAPGASRSMHIALQDLALEHLWVVYPGKQAYPLTDKISVVSLDDVPQLVSALR